MFPRVPAGLLVTSPEKSLNGKAISTRDAVGMRSKTRHETSQGWVLVQTDPAAAPAVAEVLARLAGVTVERTAGAYDIVARVDDSSVVGAERVVKTAAALPGVQLAVCCHAAAPAPASRVASTVSRQASAASRRASVPAAGAVPVPASRGATRRTRRGASLG